MSAKRGRSEEDNNAIEDSDQPTIPTDDNNDVNMETAGDDNNKDSDDNNDEESDEPSHRAHPSPTSRFGHFPKYTKPKIGPMYQCAVPKFVPPGESAASGATAPNSNNNEEEESGEVSAVPSSSSVSVSGTGSSAPSGRGRGGRGRGRGRGRGGRGRGSSSLTALATSTQEAMEVSKGEDAITMANAAAEELADNYGKTIIPRGGICIHRPIMWTETVTAERPVLDTQEEFLTFSRNMFLQTPRPSGGIDIDSIWDDEAERMFAVRADVGQEKRRTKRKAAASVDGSVDDESIRSGGEPLERKNGDCEMEGAAVEEVEREPCAKLEQSSMLPLCGLEDDEHMLSYLQASHRGDYQKAKLDTMVNVDRGYGEMIYGDSFLYFRCQSRSNSRECSPVG
jgi:hypothetical protein